MKHFWAFILVPFLSLTCPAVFAANSKKSCESTAAGQAEVVPPPFTPERFAWAEKVAKAKFIGIDPIIDSLFRQIRSWYLFPNTRKAPTVIFLAGMTGTGKTDLVRTAVKALGLSADAHYFDMENFSTQERSMTDFGYTLANGLTAEGMIRDLKVPILQVPRNPVLVFDEFQKIRTLEDGKTIQRPSAYAIFQLLGNGGRLVVQNPTHSDLRNILNNPDLYLPIPSDIKYGEEHRKKKEELTIKLTKQAEEVMLETPMQAELDLSGSLIFISMNMDDVFVGNRVTDTELVTADELNQLTAALRPSDILRGLMNMFRPEHVGRIGSRYLIFPSPSRASYQAFIQARLQDIKAVALKYYRLNLRYSDQFVERIYNEGVVPSQGMRPLLQAINSFALDPISSVFSVLDIKSEKELKRPVSVKVDIDEKNPTLARWTLTSGKQKGESLDFPIAVEYINSLKLHPEPFRSHVALRLAARVAIAARFYQELPLVVKANSRSRIKDGVIQFAPSKIAQMTGGGDWSRYRLRDELFADVVYEMAAVVAEKMIFGQNSAMSEDDLTRASVQALQMAARMGMASEDWDMTEPVSNDTLWDKGRTKIDVEVILREAAVAAEQLLREQRDFFAAVGGTLTRKVEITRADIETLLRQTWTDQEELKRIIEEPEELTEAQQFLADPGGFKFQDLDPKTDVGFTRN